MDHGQPVSSDLSMEFFPFFFLFTFFRLVRSRFSDHEFSSLFGRAGVLYEDQPWVGQEALSLPNVEPGCFRGGIPLGHNDLSRP